MRKTGRVRPAPLVILLCAAVAAGSVAVSAAAADEGVTTPAEETTTPIEKEVTETGPPPIKEVIEPGTPPAKEAGETPAKTTTETTTSPPASGAAQSPGTNPPAGDDPQAPPVGSLNPGRLSAGPTQTAAPPTTALGGGGVKGVHSHGGSRNSGRQRSSSGGRSTGRRGGAPIGGGQPGLVQSQTQLRSRSGAVRAGHPAKDRRSATRQVAPNARKAPRAGAQQAQQPSSSPLSSVGHAIARSLGGGTSLSSILLYLCLALIIVLVAGFVWTEARLAPNRRH
jgi:hypothetical protein